MEKAGFYFKKYSFDHFSFERENEDGNEISVEIEPSGAFDNIERRFDLTFKFFAFNKNYDNSKSFIKCTMVSEFHFSEDIDSIDLIPAYFYANSIAIVFPYLRAFISSISVQANNKPLILPTMNLSSLSGPLKDSLTK